MLVHHINLHFWPKEGDELAIGADVSNQGKITFNVDGKNIDINQYQLIDYIRMRCSVQRMERFNIHVGFLHNIPVLHQEYTFESLKEFQNFDDEIMYGDDDKEPRDYDYVIHFFCVQVIKKFLGPLEKCSYYFKVEDKLSDKECPVLHEKLTTETTWMYEECGHLISNTAVQRMTHSQGCPLCRKVQPLFRINTNPEKFLEQVRD